MSPHRDRQLRLVAILCKIAAGTGALVMFAADVLPTLH